VMVVYCYLAANLLSSLLALCCNWTMIGQLGKKSRATVTEMFHFGKYNMGTNITGNLAGLISTFIVKFYLGSAALAIYNAGTKLLQVVELPLRSVVYTAAPSIASSFNEDNKAAVMHKMKKNAGLLTLALVPVCLLTIIFADFAILVLGGSKYVDTEAPNILRLFMAVSLFFPIERFFSLTLDVIHMPKINFLKIILFFVVTVIGYYLAATLSGSLYALTVSYYITICTSVTIGYVAINRYYARFGFSDIFAEGIRGAGEIIRNLKIRFRIS
jgi:O-antigen/teichoic acid export membrane protein